MCNGERVEREGGESGLKSAFNLSRSYQLVSVLYAWICGCMCGALIWTCLVGAERSMPDNFGVPRH